MSLHYYAFTYIMVSGSLRSINSELEEMGEIQGASKAFIVRKITLPLVMPAVMSAAIMTLSKAIGTYGVAANLGLRISYYTLATKMHDFINTGSPTVGYCMKLGVVSNTASLYQVFEILGQYGIRDFFRDVTLSSVTGYRKPDENIFKVSLLQVQSEPSTCAYVGDTYSRDIIGARRAGFGMTFHIHSFLTNLKDTDVNNEAAATYTLEDIYEIYPILRELRAQGNA